MTDHCLHPHSTAKWQTPTGAGTDVTQYYWGNVYVVGFSSVVVDVEYPTVLVRSFPPYADSRETVPMGIFEFGIELTSRF